MLRLRTAILLAVGCVCSTSLMAAPASTAYPSAPPAWRAALQRMQSSNPQLQAARAELAAAGARVDAAARPQYNPELAFEAERVDVDRRAVALGMPIDIAGKRAARAQQGHAHLRAAEATYAAQRQALALHWLQALTDLTLGAREVELGQRRLQLMQRFDALAARRLTLGDVSRPERDLAALAVGEALLQQAELRANLAMAQATWITANGATTVAVPAWPQSLPEAADTIEPRAAAELPRLAVARAERDAGVAGVKLARRARWPDPVVSITSGEVRSGPINDRVMGLRLAIALPVRNSGAAELRAAHAEAEAAAASLRAEEQAAQAALLEARARYQALRDAALAFRDGRAGAFEERAALLEQLWRAGEIGTSDYLLQLKQNVDTALSAQQLERRTWLAWFDYLGAAGRLGDWLALDTIEATP